MVSTLRTLLTGRAFRLPTDGTSRQADRYFTTPDRRMPPEISPPALPRICLAPLPRVVPLRCAPHCVSVCVCHYSFIVFS